MHEKKTTYNILAVDDNPMNLRLLIDMLTWDGYTIRPASTGQRALDSALLDPPDLILLDINMPDISGFEICKRLKADERTRHIPIIFISALIEVANKITGFQVGGVDYITKPFQTEEVLERVRLHLSIQTLQNDLKDEIHRRQQAEEELRALNQQLRQANAGKDLLFSVIAHDLRNPFVVLMTLVEVLIANLDDFSRDQLTDKLNLVLATSQNIFALVSDLLSWSRFQRGIMDYEPLSLSLDELVQSQIFTIKAAAAAKQIRLSTSIPPDLRVHADQYMFTTIFRNLLSNAVKFTDAEGLIDITAEPRNGMLAITITDTGVGISPERLKHLFEIHQKRSRPGTRGEPGTGLGLILCKEFVEKHGGHLTIESREGEGTTCQFTLPQG